MMFICIYAQAMSRCGGASWRVDSSSARSTCRRYLVITTCLAPLAYACVCVRVCAVQVGLLLPLSVTGFVWGVLYVGSGNLLVPILIHALWNTRVFLGSYLGL